MTVVLERNQTLTTEHLTEPYEAGWAIEARWFVRVLDCVAGTTLQFTTQVSPDGLLWVDIDDARHEISQPGILSWPTERFGHWLRLKTLVEGDAEASAKVLIYLVLKG